MDIIAWLSKLIEFDTTSHRSNLALIETLNRWCNEHQLSIRLTYDETKQKANLVATIPTIKGEMQGGLVLSGHTDVVPVDGQHWETPPFQAVIKENRVYGRGACDMKGFLAVILSLVPYFKTLSLQKPLHLAFSYDEEIGCHGAKVLLLDLATIGIKPSACIVGEPTNMQLITAHKGITLFRCQVKGVAAHSSLTPSGCNAIEYAAQLIQFIRSIAESFKEGPLDNCFDVPFTSISTNRIQGGMANNIIPEHCEFIFECRHLPSFTPDQLLNQINHYIKKVLLPAMQKEQPEVAITIEAIAAVPALAVKETSFSMMLEKIMQEKSQRKVAYATEAGFFQLADIPTLICGPGSIEQAHKPNEFVEISQLMQCERLIKEVVKDYCER